MACAGRQGLARARGRLSSSRSSSSSQATHGLDRQEGKEWLRAVTIRLPSSGSSLVPSVSRTSCAVREGADEGWCKRASLGECTLRRSHRAHLLAESSRALGHDRHLLRWRARRKPRWHDLPSRTRRALLAATEIDPQVVATDSTMHRAAGARSAPNAAARLILPASVLQSGSMQLGGGSYPGTRRNNWPEHCHLQKRGLLACGSERRARSLQRSSSSSSAFTAALMQQLDVLNMDAAIAASN